MDHSRPFSLIFFFINRVKNIRESLPPASIMFCNTSSTLFFSFFNFSNSLSDLSSLSEDAIKTEDYDEELSCLITSSHQIPVGEFTFWDWED